MKLFLLAVCLYCCSSSAAAVRSSEGREFALAFPASRSDTNAGECLIYVTARSSTTITVSTASGSDDYSIDPTDPDITFINFSPNLYRTSEDIENKAILVSSLDSDISIFLSNFRESDIVETSLVLPRDDTQLEYQIIMYDYISETICDSGTTTVFYSVIAFDDDTDIEIFQPSLGGGYTSRLVRNIDRLQVFTERELKTSFIDYTGFKVVSTKPVSVTAGNSCMNLASGSSSSLSRPIWSSMPGTSEAGSTYISHPIITDVGGSKDYILRVLAISDDTQVTFRDSSVSTTIDAGDFYEQNIDEGFEDEVITCSSPCVVAQYGVADDSAIFMVVLPPTDQYVTSARFTQPSTLSSSNSNLDHFISIILLSNSPSTSGITLDGTDISGDSDWVVTNDYSYLVYELTSAIELVHTLEANIRFSCMVNGHTPTSADGDGYGYIAAVSGSAAPPPADKIPVFRIQMFGDFVTTASLDNDCSISYSQTFNQISTSMIQEVNDRIGTAEVCSSYTTNDMTVISVSTAFIADDTDNTGTTYLAYVMSVNTATVSVDGVESCGADIANFLQPHSNWPNGDPLPDQTGCPALSFTSNQFNQSGNVFICPVNSGRSSDQYAVPRYSLGHSGQFSTVDGSTISVECTIAYTQSLTSSSANQLQDVNSQINSGGLCVTGRDGDVSLQTVTDSLTTDQDSGSTYQTYIFQLSGNATTSYLYSCADEVSTYLQPHSNWNDPIIAAPGCPAVEFSPAAFTEEVQEWIC